MKEVLEEVIVQTGRGAVAGFRADYGSDKSKLWYGQADVFLGIPYVKPPVGDLRFAKPQKLTAFPGASPYNASKFGDACPQNNYDLRGLNISEDCLFLNIFTPDAKSTYKYPVMFFIHGGAFLTGHTGDFPVPGIVRNLVSRGVVVVTIQYRLGMLGFFTTRTPEFPANLGLLDQTEAMKFIIDEIPNFGGNPYQITLFGQSAGSASVSAHLFSPVSQGLFQQAIMESGSIYTCLDGSTGFKNMSQERAQELCSFNQTDWDSKNYTFLKTCLMNKTYDDFLHYEYDDFYGWNMVQDDYFLPDLPRNLFKKRPNIPVIYGSCHDEWSLADLQQLAEGATHLDQYSNAYFDLIVGVFLTLMLPDQDQRQGDLMSVINSVYVSPPPSDTDHVGWMRTLNDVMTSSTQTAFIGKEVDWYVYNNNSNVYTYEFEWPTQIGRPIDVPGWNPVFHCSELYMVFMPSFFWEPVYENGTRIDQELEIADFMGQSWTNFAKYGKPTLDSSWKPTTSLLNQEFYRINITKSMELGYRRIDRMVWDQVFRALVGDLPVNNPVNFKRKMDEF
ncbi:hypothetical protein FO519_003774 [Halicephalobus sp. NKZ332]|nr:hypothetical protein FO519_003774 [Halicephalobus sp. NKZ332]